MNDALDLIVENLQETQTNCKKTFAMWKRNLPLDTFSKRLLDIWVTADGENQRRLAIAYPQIASCIIESQTLPPKKREKYLNKLLNIKD